MKKPLMDRLKVTPRCNQRCLFCDARAGREPGRAEALRLIAARGSAAELNITGGEPTLLPALPAYIRAARRAGYRRVRLLTNALLLADAALCRKLRRAGLDEVMAAFQHTDAAEADRVAGRPGAQALKLAGLRAAAAAGLEVSANILVYSGNYRDLPEIALYLRRGLGVRRLMFSFLEPHCDNVRARPWLAPPLKPALAALARALAACRAARVRTIIPYNGALPACVYAAAGISLRPDGAARAAAPGEGRRKASFCAACRQDALCAGFLPEYYSSCLRLLRGRARGRRA